MTRDPADEIRQAAAADRARRTKADRRALRRLTATKQAAAGGERRVVCQMIETALTDDGSALGRAFTYVLLGAPVLLLFLLSRLSPAVMDVMQRKVLGWVVWFGAIATGAVLMWFVPMLLGRMRGRWLHRLGHGFDADHYLELLSKNRREATLVARCRFARAWDPTLRESTLDAVRHWFAELVDRRWIDDCTLELASSALETTRMTQDSVDGVITAKAYFTNRPVHDCFVHFTRRVLPKLDATVPVVQLDVEIRGEVLPWDARADQVADV